MKTSFGIQKHIKKKKVKSLPKKNRRTKHKVKKRERVPVKRQDPLEIENTGIPDMTTLSRRINAIARKLVNTMR